MKNAVRLNTMVLLAAVVVFGIFAPMEPAMAGPAICAKGDPGLTPLLSAAYHGDMAGVRRLLATGTNINATDDSGATALMCAVTGQHPAIVKVLIDKGAAINAKDKYGWTALMYAFLNRGSGDGAQYLLAKGANADVVGNDGLTALLVYARYSQQEGDSYVDNELITKSRNVINATNDHGKTALMIALDNKTASCHFIVSLLHHGATIDAAGKYGSEVLVTFLGGGFSEPCSMQSDKRHEVIRYFLARGANLGDARNIIMFPAQAEPLGSHHVTSKASFSFLGIAQSRGRQTSVFHEIIIQAGKMDPPPTIPEKAKRYFQMGITAAKDARDTNDFGEAAGRFLKAVLWAPYWAEPYFDLGLMFEQTKDYSAAAEAFKLYLDADPGTRNADAVRRHIYTDEERSRERWNRVK
ncbi:MAG: ankyrin repeat domain-containing protein [Gammaproteobacteria bacterium]